MITDHLISILIFTPLAAALVVLALPKKSEEYTRYIALSATVIQVIAMIFIIAGFRTDVSGYQMIERSPWITIDLAGYGLGGYFIVEYLVALDGLSLPIVAMSVIVLVIATISSWKITDRRKGYFSLLLIMNAAIIGSFCALDLLLFYLFFEFMLLPMYFLIGLWGGPKREYASIKFFLYTLLGSVLILLVIIATYLTSTNGSGLHTFNLIDLTSPDSGFQLVHDSWRIMGIPFGSWAFVLLLIGFGIKLPMVPVHTWLPDAHVEAPTPISVILAALLLKIGGYGLLRIAYPLFPIGAVNQSWIVAFVGMVSIVYGAMNALAAKDFKRLIAYSSVSHMGFVLLGVSSLTTEGITGAVYQMVSHGFISAMLFIIAGVIYDRTGDRKIDNYSGLSEKMPTYTAFVVLAFFAALGLPGLSGFVGEMMTLLGAFKATVIPTWMVIVATSGLIFGAGYCLWTIQRMFLGPYAIRAINASMHDLDVRERLMLSALSVFIVLMGILPQLVIQYINPFSTLLWGILQPK